jgi:SAM-dependent methyltransferase
VSGDQFTRFGLGEEDRAAWEASGASDLDAWLLDRVARRPTGARARAVYGAEEVHDFARRAILAALALGPDDRLLEIGCGGGLLLRDARATGAHIVGLDHSEEMVRLAAEHAVVVHAGAEALPFADGSFTAVAMSIVFIFLPNPAQVLAECRRVLEPGGRLAIYTTGPELRGTPAAPEPFAGLSHFHSDDELVALAADAGFLEAAVENEGGGQLLTARAPQP